METTEIRMITDLDKAIPQSLDFNFEEVKEWLAENLAAYKSMVVTEDAIGASKADKAKIAKISKAISEQRIAIKKRYLEPYNVFEAQMKELSGMCDEAAKNIDVQVKTFDEKRKAEKRETLRGYFSSVNTQAWLSFERIENPRWMNVTYDMETAKADIQAAVTAISENVTAITESGGEFENEMLLEYQKTLDLGAAMRRGSELKRMKQEQEARRAAQEAAERARQEAQAKAERERAERIAQKRAEAEAAERAEKLLNAETAPEPVRVEEPQETEQVLDFRCYVTRTQMIALRDWLNANGIRFCRVPKFGD
jgi:hypothetical protein